MDGERPRRRETQFSVQQTQTHNHSVGSNKAETMNRRWTEEGEEGVIEGGMGDLRSKGTIPKKGCDTWQKPGGFPFWFSRQALCLFVFVLLFVVFLFPHRIPFFLPSWEGVRVWHSEVYVMLLAKYRQVQHIRYVSSQPWPASPLHVLRDSPPGQDSAGGGPPSWETFRVSPPAGTTFVLSKSVS